MVDIAQVFYIIANYCLLLLSITMRGMLKILRMLVDLEFFVDKFFFSPALKKCDLLSSDLHGFWWETVIWTIIPLYIICHFSPAARCFFIFGFQKFYYDMARFYWWLYYLGFAQLFKSVNLHYFFNYLWKFSAIISSHLFFCTNIVLSSS